MKFVARNTGTADPQPRRRVASTATRSPTRSRRARDTMQPGETGEPIKVTLTPGTYRLVCTIANHDDLGQYGTLVRCGDHADPPTAARAFRDTIGRFSTGVAVVTAIGPGGPGGDDDERRDVAVAGPAAAHRLLRAPLAHAGRRARQPALRRQRPARRRRGARRGVRLQARRAGEVRGAHAAPLERAPRRPGARSRARLDRLRAARAGAAAATTRSASARSSPAAQTRTAIRSSSTAAPTRRSSPRSLVTLTRPCAPRASIAWPEAAARIRRLGGLHARPSPCARRCFRWRRPLRAAARPGRHARHRECVRVRRRRAARCRSSARGSRPARRHAAHDDGHAPQAQAARRQSR